MAWNAKPDRFIPPFMQGWSDEQIMQASVPKYREGNGKPTNINGKDTDGMSKQALKNKKKREARKAKKAAEATEPEPTSPPPQPAEPQATGNLDDDKKIRNIKKKLRQIETLKEKQAAGETLEKNQEDKLASEAALLQELEALSV